VSSTLHSLHLKARPSVFVVALKDACIQQLVQRQRMCSSSSAIASCHLWSLCCWIVAAALPHMMGVLNSRPALFTSLEAACSWAVRSGTCKNKEMAGVSFPSQLQQVGIIKLDSRALAPANHALVVCCWTAVFCECLPFCEKFVQCNTRHLHCSEW
jgi:hypothetical protein